MLSHNVLIYSYLSLPNNIPWRRERLPTPVLWPGEFHEIVHGVAKSQTQLSGFHLSISIYLTPGCRLSYSQHIPRPPSSSPVWETLPDYCRWSPPVCLAEATSWDFLQPGCVTWFTALYPKIGEKPPWFQWPLLSWQLLCPLQRVSRELCWLPVTAWLPNGFLRPFVTPAFFSCSDELGAPSLPW